MSGAELDLVAHCRGEGAVGGDGQAEGQEQCGKGRRPMGRSADREGHHVMASLWDHQHGVEMLHQARRRRLG
jgi:hypothetical protein